MLYNAHAIARTSPGGLEGLISPAWSVRFRPSLFAFYGEGASMRQVVQFSFSHSSSGEAT